MKATEMEAGMSVFVLRNVFIKNMGSALRRTLERSLSFSFHKGEQIETWQSLKIIKFSPLINIKEKRNQYQNEEKIATFS